MDKTKLVTFYHYRGYSELSPIMMDKPFSQNGSLSWMSLGTPTVSSHQAELSYPTYFKRFLKNSRTALLSIWPIYSLFTRARSDENGVLFSYLDWSYSVFICLFRLSSKGSVRTCGWLIIYNSATPIQQTKPCEPLPALSLFRWQVFWCYTIIRPTRADL